MSINTVGAAGAREKQAQTTGPIVTQQYGVGIGGIGADYLPNAIGIRGRVSQQIEEAVKLSRRTDVLPELDALFNKHPEIARILDLLESANILWI